MSTLVLQRFPVPREFVQLSSSLYETVVKNIGDYVIEDAERHYGKKCPTFQNVVIIKDRTEFHFHWLFGGSLAQQKEFNEHTLQCWNQHCDNALRAFRDDGRIK